MLNNLKKKILKWKIIKKKIKKARHDIAEAEIFIDFYEARKNDMGDDKKSIGDMDLKIGQLHKAIATNLDFIHYHSK